MNTYLEAISSLSHYILREDLQSGRRGLVSSYRRTSLMRTFAPSLLRRLQLADIHTLFVCVAGLMARPVMLSLIS